MDPARQPLSFAGGNHYAINLIPCPLSFQSCPLPLHLAALPVGEIPAMTRTKVLHPTLYALPLASLRRPPCLRATGKPHCHRGIVPPCCANRSLSSPLHHRDAGAKHPMTTPRVVPLLPPPLLAPFAAPSSLQLPSHAPHRHRALAHP
jgi:hypothetical protein